MGRAGGNWDGELRLGLSGSYWLELGEDLGVSAGVARVVHAGGDDAVVGSLEVELDRVAGLGSDGVGCEGELVVGTNSNLEGGGGDAQALGEHGKDNFGDHGDGFGVIDLKGKEPVFEVK